MTALGWRLGKPCRGDWWRLVETEVGVYPQDGQSRVREVWPLTQGHPEGPVAVPVASKPVPWLWRRVDENRSLGVIRGKCLGSQAPEGTASRGAAVEPLAEPPLGSVLAA